MKREIFITPLSKKMLHLLLGVLFATNAYAAHIIGGVITYQCVGFTGDDPNTNSRTYRFVMKIYRDCQGNGAGFDSDPNGAFPASVTVYREGNNTPFDVFNLAPPIVKPVNPNPGNACVVVPPNVCVQEGEYVFFVELPIIDESYFVTYQRCCRNNTITNIVNPGASGATYTMELTPEAQSSCNRSPEFNNFPPPVLCVGEPFTFNHAATDADGDLLIYELCTPFLGGGTMGNFGPNGVGPNPDLPPPYAAVNFNAPTYTALNPLGTASGLSINATTGILTGTPNIVGQFVVGICVSEYRNGVLMSLVRRDFQFNVTTCQILVSARLQAPQENGVYVYNSCGDYSLLFANQSVQQQNIANFRWEFDLGGPPTLVNQWNAAVTFPGPGNYSGRLYLNSGAICPDTAYLDITINPEITAEFVSEYDTCVAGLVDFRDLSVADAGAVMSWDWRFGDGKVSTTQSPQHDYSDPGERIVTLQVQDINGCRDTIQKIIRYFPVPVLILVSPNRVEDCPPAEISFNNLSSPIDETYDVVWNFGDGGASNEISPTHVFEEAGVYDVSLSITSPIGCATDTVFRELIQIYAGPEADFTVSPEKPDPFDPVVNFTDRSIDAWRWNWNFDGVHTSIEQNPVYTLQDTGLHRVVLRVTNVYGCQDTTSRLIDVAPFISFHMPNAFTPNNDTVNDVFKGVGYLRGVQRFSMKIWSRWGDLIFESSDPDSGWNGLIGNQQAPQGVYLYEVSLDQPRGAPEFYKGFVTLVR